MKHLRTLTEFLSYTVICLVMFNLKYSFCIDYSFCFRFIPYLSRTFPASRNLRFLIVGLWNAIGVRNKSSDIVDFIYACNNLDIILVSQTHFSNSYTAKVASYELFHVARPPAGGCTSSGTAVYLKCGVITSLPNSNALKLLLLC